MASYRVWGEWQDVNDSQRIEGPSADAAAEQFARGPNDAFPEWIDGEKCSVWVLPWSDAIPEGPDPDDDDLGYDPTEDDAAEIYTVTLHLEPHYTTRRG